VIFLDTSFLFALVSSKDEHRQRVVEVFGSLGSVPMYEPPHTLTLPIR
jgi:predicted nucleic acid-binding protein